MINYYKELGVKTNASKEEIKLAYLSMLKKYHPDIYDGDPKIAQDKTALLNECYSTLKDDEKRLKYDQKLFASKQKSPDDYILREFFRRFSTNKTSTNQSTQNTTTQQKKSNKKPTQKSQAEKKSKKQNNEKQTQKHQKSIEYSLDEQQERRENKKLTIYIIIILSVILGIILASLLIK